jgi:hypothetical protein
MIITMSNETAVTKNDAFWKEYSKTNTAYVKKPEKGLNGLTAIDAYYMFQRATEAFGMCGSGWGYDIKSEEYRESGPIMNADKTETIDHECDHILRVCLWYMLDGKRCEIEHFGITKYKTKNKWGVVTDEEAPKKSLTDAIKKCLSMLGFCAEVYQGKFDDANYKQSADVRSQVEESDERDELVQSEVDSITEWTSNQIKSAEGVPNFTVFMSAMDNIAKKIITKCKPLGINPNPIVSLCKASIETRKQSEPKEGTK